MAVERFLPSAIAHFEPADLIGALATGIVVLDADLCVVYANVAAQDLLAVLREALTNIARHAHAHTADVDLSGRPRWLTLDIRDDGTGLGDTTRRSGLANMRRRAEQHGGDFVLEPGPGSGTLLTWTALLDS